jgi:hypothetical protein
LNWTFKRNNIFFTMFLIKVKSVKFAHVDKLFLIPSESILKKSLRTVGYLFGYLDC